MKRHVKIYMEHFGLIKSDVVLCEKCGEVANDIHHIDPKGMGGRKGADVIQNLIALCRFCHDRAHGKIYPKLSKDRLKRIHNQYLKK